MGFITDFFRPKQTEVESFEINDAHVKVVEVGTSGTENYAGYLEEEYLQELRGKDAADVYDKMRRSDAKVKMGLSAIKGPIKGASWTVETLEESPEAGIQKKMIEAILFHDLDKTWDKKLNEILTVFDFGYCLLEKTYKVVIDHPELDSFIGLKSLAFRSQKTIERFNICPKSGDLISVSQYAYGDAGKIVDIPAEHLVRFVLEEEGGNFEGISILRAAYGPWLRKNRFLRLIAAGVEKYAIPTPILDIPEGQFSNAKFTAQYNNAIATLKAYTSHQLNYITKPKGWDLTIQTNSFDAEKTRANVKEENLEIVNAMLANFLELGQSGSGSYALSTDLSDFFLGALEFVASHICETINKSVIDDLIKLNFPSGKRLVELRCDGVSDKAGKEFAEVLGILSREKIIIPDEKLEENVRKRYNLPAREASTEREVEKQPGFQFADDKKKVRTEQPENERKINKFQKDLEKIFAKNLIPISQNIIDRIIKNYSNSNDRTQFKAVDISTISGVPAFKKEFRDYLAKATLETVALKKSQYPRFKNIKLSETESRIRLAEEEKLSPVQRSRNNATVDVLVNTMVNDIEKEASLQYLNSVESSGSAKVIASDMSEKVNKKVANDLVKTAAVIQATKTFTDAAFDFFYTPGVLEQVESFTFVNQSPVAEICQSLAGRTFKADDPDVDRYRPPLHHNCKSYYVANLIGQKNNPPLTENAGNISKAAEKSISLSEGAAIN